MSRLQLGLNVKDLDAAVAFYTKLFGTGPKKVRPGYANFAIADPPLKLVLFEGGEAGSVNHLGVEFETADDVADSLDRLRAEEIDLYDVGTVTCCYARSDKGWTDSPDGNRWEMYTVLADADVMHEGEDSAACGPCEIPAAKVSLAAVETIAAVAAVEGVATIEAVEVFGERCCGAPIGQVAVAPAATASCC